MHGARREEVVGREYLVTVLNARYWSEWPTNTVSHNWTIVYAHSQQMKA